MPASSLSDIDLGVKIATGLTTLFSFIAGWFLRIGKRQTAVEQRLDRLEADMSGVKSTNERLAAAIESLAEGAHEQAKVLARLDERVEHLREDVRDALR